MTESANEYLKKFSEAHLHSDLDHDIDSMHHTLGLGPNQAAQGNHWHPLEFTPEETEMGRVMFDYGNNILAVHNGVDWITFYPGEPPVGQIPIGGVTDYFGDPGALPWNFQALTGQTISQVDYPEWFAINNIVASTFTLPNAAGRMTKGKKAAETLGGLYGDADNSIVLSVAQLPSHNHSGSATSDGHNHTGTTTTDSHSHGIDGAVEAAAGSARRQLGDGSPVNDITSKADSHNHTFTTSTDSHSHTITVGSTGSGSAINIENANIALYKIIRLA